MPRSLLLSPHISKRRQVRYIEGNRRGRRRIKVSVLLVMTILSLIGLIAYTSKENSIIVADPSCKSPIITSQSKVLAVFEWRDVVDLTNSSIENSLNIARKLGINEVYLNIGSYVDLIESSDKTLGDKNMNSFEASIDNYMLQAKNRDIKVRALAGGNKWASNGHFYLTETVINFVKKYNLRNESPQTFAGLELDVEPYTLPEHEKNKISSIEGLVVYIKNAYSFNAREKSDSLRLSFSIPFWLDSIEEESSNLDGKSLIEELIDISGVNKGRLTIMAYRNFIEGNDGIKKLVEYEFDYAKVEGLEDILILGQEFGDIEPVKTTYFSTGLYYAVENINKLYTLYGPNRSFAGVSINDMKTLESLYSHDRCIN